MMENAEHIHAGHDHGWFGELMEHLLEQFPLAENWREFLAHFIVDTLQIFLLLFVIMTVVYFLSSYINMDKLHHRLAHLKSLPGFFLATAAGVLSPFCSCSIIPVLMGLLSVGVPVSVCLCYLTASSLINLTAILSIFAVAGPSFGIAYLIGSLVIIVASSLALAFLPLDHTVKPFASEHHHHHTTEVCGHCFWHRLKCALLSTLNVIKKSWLFIVLGVLLSSGIMAFFSMDAIGQAVNENAFLSVFLISLIGLPLHSDIFSISPLLLLLQKLAPGVALSFALSTMALSIPSVLILTRALKTKTVLIYCGVVVVCTLLTGWLGLFII